MVDMAKKKLYIIKDIKSGEILDKLDCITEGVSKMKLHRNAQLIRTSDNCVMASTKTSIPGSGFTLKPSYVKYS